MWNLIWTPGNFQMAVSRKRKKLPELRWAQNSRLVEGFHPLFHESGVAPLFHPLSASFSQKRHFFRVFQVCVTVCLLSVYAPGTPLHVGKKKFAVPAKMSTELQNLWALSFHSFGHFHSDILKTHLSQLCKVLETKKHQKIKTPKDFGLVGTPSPTI